MEEASQQLPHPQDLSPSLRNFLSDRLRTEADLLRLPELESGLQTSCSDLERSLLDLSRSLSDCIADHAIRSSQVSGHLQGVRDGLTSIRSCSIADQGERSEQILAEELPALAKEVARVETVRAYAETALKLDNLIGDVEDAVSSYVTKKLIFPRSVHSEETHLTAINSLKQIEDILTSVTRTRPRWARLVLAVDNRVDRALAILRPQAIADHRSLLASLGWPPPLASSNLASSSTGRSIELSNPNPLCTMKGELKSKYCESFLSLCNLQELQSQRKSRQLEGHNREVALRQPLWVIEELVNPISLVSEHHFAKWVEKPEFIFALVYKIARDFTNSMDEILQPLVDKARLAGYSCREEWISAMVTSLTTYLAKEVFPTYVSNLQDGDSSNVPSQARISWLHLVDFMMSFDKRIQSLITNSKLLLSLWEEENLQRVSSLSVFCDRPDWLQIWAEIELVETLNKLRSVMQDEKLWNTRVHETTLMTGSEDYKSPAISGAFLQLLSFQIDRSRPLPNISLRSKFLSLAAAPIIVEFLDYLLRRCQEAEGLTALADDDALVKVSDSVNVARHCESVLIEWLEDPFFLELETPSGEGLVFEEEIGGFKEFQREWVEKISTAILRGFDAGCREYLKNKKQWQEKAEGGSVSRAFVGPLDYLHGKISKLEDELNFVDFVGVWRLVATGVDQLVFTGVLQSNARFHNSGVERFCGDMDVLFGVFAAWCLRPVGFFPKLGEGMRLLRMDESRLAERGKEGWLRENGVRHLTAAEAEKIAKSRVFMGG